MPLNPGKDPCRIRSQVSLLRTRTRVSLTRPALTTLAALLVLCSALAFTPMRPAARLLRQGSFFRSHRAGLQTASSFSYVRRQEHRCVYQQQALSPLHSSASIPDIMAVDNGNKTFTTYERWVRRLYQTNLFHPAKLGLQNMEAIYDLLGRPMDKPNVTVIHIAGTNGKGSVALKIAKTLELSSLRVGLFCSPHVSSFRERMQVNGKLITEEQVIEYVPHIYSLCKEHDIPATFFEITTALAFRFFDKENVDVVVLETGLGGRLDATNVVSAPALCVITSIGLEHTRILGNTIEEIALEKGGIIKANRPVLVGPHCPHEVLRQCAKEKNAQAYYTCEDVLGEASTEITDYDEENARIATAAIKLLEKFDIPDDLVQKGTQSRPPCRFEVVELNGLTAVLDVAHNPAAMEYLVRKLQAEFPHDKFRIVVGMSSDKDLGQCGRSVLEAVHNDVNAIHLVQAAHPRAATIEAIVEAEPRLGKSRWNDDDRSIATQVHEAMQLAKENGEVLVVCGSVFLMSESREALGFDEPRDTKYIAEVAGAGARNGQENFANMDVEPESQKGNS